jgi:hypothetical protein
LSPSRFTTRELVFAFRADRRVPLPARAAQREHTGVEEAAINDGQQVVGRVLPELVGILLLTPRVRHDACRGEEVRTNGMNATTRVMLSVLPLALPKRSRFSTVSGTRSDVPLRAYTAVSASDEGHIHAIAFRGDRHLMP